MYYQNTIQAFKRRLSEEFPGSQPSQTQEGAPVHEYLLWMVIQIEQMDTASLDSALKAGRWLGWVLHAIEETLGWWPNAYSRDIVRVDVAAGRDRPH